MRAMLLPRSERKLQRQGLSSAYGSRVTFLLRGQEKSNPKRRPPRWRALRVRGWATGFVDRASCPDDKLAGIPAGHPAGFPSPTRRAIGARAEQRASCAHFSEEPYQQPKQEQRHAASLWFRLQLTLLLLRFITECGPRWPAALPGVPCAAVRRGRQAAQREPTGMSVPFRTGRMPVRKARPRLTDLPGTMPGKRQAGWPFSLATQRESNSGAKGARKLLLSREPRLTANRI